MMIKIHKEDENGNVYTLMEEDGLTVIWDWRTLIVPQGFQSDGASVPRFFWRFVFPPGDTKALRAAFAHDFVYRTHPIGWTKQNADQMFYDLLVADGIGSMSAWCAYQGVKWFGKSSWDGDA